MSRQRVLIISPFFPPQPAVASLRAHSFAENWARVGAEVTVLTTAKREDQTGLDLASDGFEVVEIPHRTRWLLDKLRSAHKDPSAAIEGRPAGRRPFIEALRMVRSRTGIYSAQRMPDLTDHWVEPATAWALAQPEWDVVLSSSGPYTAHLVAHRLKTAGAARRWVMDFRDLWTDNHVSRGLFPFTLRERRLQRRCLDAADLVITVSPPLAETLRDLGAGNVEVVYNGYTPGALPPARLLPADGTTHLVYTGTFYPTGQDPRPLLEALAVVRREAPDVAARVRLVVAGSGRARWMRLAAETGVANMLDHRGVCTRDDALRLQRDADALVSLEWNDPTKGVLSGKVFEYLVWDGPILVIGGGPADPIARLVREAGRGWVLGRDPDAIAGAVMRIADGEPGPVPKPDVVKRYSRECQARRLIETVRDHASETAGSPI